MLHSILPPKCSQGTARSRWNSSLLPPLSGCLFRARRRNACVTSWREWVGHQFVHGHIMRYITLLDYIIMCLNYSVDAIAAAQSWFWLPAFRNLSKQEGKEKVDVFHRETHQLIDSSNQLINSSALSFSAHPGLRPSVFSASAAVISAPWRRRVPGHQMVCWEKLIDVGKRCPGRRRLIILIVNDG